MPPFDDNDLIDRLQAGIAERQSGISAPEGIGEHARRDARKRSATRVVSAGVPVLAAAGVATVLATSSGSGSPAAGGVRAGGSGKSADPAAVVSGGPVRTENTAYIVKRVKSKVAGDSQSDTVTNSYTYDRGNVSSDGSLVNLGPMISDGYDYIARDGTDYYRDTLYQKGGGQYLTSIDVLSPDVNGKRNDARTTINPVNHTYSQTHFSGLSDSPARLPNPNLYSTPSEVQQALQSGQVTKMGTLTINGTRAITLSIKVPNGAPDAQTTHLTLYVDAQTYQPLRTVMIVKSHPELLLVADWMAPTPDNIATAENHSIPAGYTKVDTTY